MMKFRFMTLTMHVAAVSAFSCVVGLAQADPVPNEAHQGKSAHAIRARGTDPHASDASRARAMKAAQLKKRQDAKKNLQQILDAQKAAPDSAGKGVAQ